MEVRKYVTILEEIHSDGGRPMDPPGKRAAAVAVIKNPFAGQYVEDLTPLMDIGDALGDILGRRAVAALGISPEKAEGYGKGAIVGENGEREHAKKRMGPPFYTPSWAKPFRDAVLGKGGRQIVDPFRQKDGWHGNGNRRAHQL